MHAAGVTCTDCHDAHDLKVKGSADRVCAACHLTEKFESPEAPLPQGELDRRELRRLPHADPRLHGRPRAPRPQHARARGRTSRVSIGTPNACTQCHRDKSNRWAADAARKWWGDKVAAGAALRRDRPRRPRGARGRAGGAGGLRGRRGPAGDPAGDGRLAARPARGPLAGRPRRGRSPTPSRSSASGPWRRRGRSSRASACAWSRRSSPTPSGRFASRRPRC